MVFSLYKLNEYGEIHLNDSNELSPLIIKSLEIIEEEIVLEYLKKQNYKVGIQNLGNEIRFNKKIEEQFNSPIGNNILIKMTENKRSFFKVFLDSINSYKDLNIYFFVLERNFGVDSNLVDKSFPCVDEIKNNLKLLLNNFRPSERLSVSIIEMCDFSDYFVQKYEGFSSINKKI
jgi:hypothetical protein